MYFLFFLFWIIFNGRVTLEIILFGLVISAAVYAFICKFMDYSIKKDLKLMKKMFHIFYYVCVLIVEVLKANFATMKIILSAKCKREPVIVKFITPLKSKTAKAVLANSITLTPGTITISLEGDEFSVHCLDKRFSTGMDESIFVKLLLEIEK